MKIKAAKVFIENDFRENQMILIENERIMSIESAKPNESCDYTFGPDTYLVPGMIDLHIHGAKGFDVMDGTPEALNEMRSALAAEGVTGFLATTMTESIPKIEQALRNIKHSISQQNHHGAEILGIHLEGPFLSPQFMGAQQEDFLLTPNANLLKKWQEDSGQSIKLMTLAPELPDALAFIHTANALGILVSIGHTGATFAQTIAAADAGAVYATHLFNAMSGVHHRTPGAAAAILTDERITAELIADGHHVVPDMLKFAVKCKGLKNLILVTDAMRAKCLKQGEYDLGGQIVIVDQGAARLKKNGVLAGSVLQLNGALRNFIEFTGLPLTTCLPLVTETPARLLKMDQDLGTLSPFKKANLVILNPLLEVLATFRQGQLIYRRT